MQKRTSHWIQQERKDINMLSSSTPIAPSTRSLLAKHALFLCLFGGFLLLTWTTSCTGDTPKETTSQDGTTQEQVVETSADANTTDTQTKEPSTEPALLREFKENPQEMISKIGLSETKSGGYRVGDISNSPYLRQSGLQSGDVILSVNGQTLSNVQNDRTQLAGLMAGGTARLEIQRGDIRFTITASMPNSG